MKSARRGKRTLSVEVGNISKHGFWLLIGDREHFLPFDQFPWFRSVPVGQLLNVRLPQPHHLYWPDIDVDLTVDSIVRPEEYPLVSRERPGAAPRPGARKKPSPKARRAPSRGRR